MLTEVVSHIESNAESNAMAIFENDLTKQVNSVTLIMAYIIKSFPQNSAKQRVKNLKAWSSYNKRILYTLDPGVVRRGLFREGRSGNILCDFCNTHSGHRAGASYNTALVLSTTKNASLASIMIYNPTQITIDHFLRFFFLPPNTYIAYPDRSVNILKSHVATPSYYRRNQQMDSIQTSFKALFETSNFNFLNEFRPVFVTQNT